MIVPVSSDPTVQLEGPGRGSEIFAPDLLGGKVVLVTGGGTGLGKATGLELARCGAKVLIADARRLAIVRDPAQRIGMRA